MLEKVEGMAVLPRGQALIVTDIDGVDDASGEIQLSNLGNILRDVSCLMFQSWRPWRQLWICLKL